MSHATLVSAVTKLIETGRSEVNEMQPYHDRLAKPFSWHLGKTPPAFAIQPPENQESVTDCVAWITGEIICSFKDEPETGGW
jgi:hypothetical protein